MYDAPRGKEISVQDRLISHEHELLKHLKYNNASLDQFIKPVSAGIMQLHGCED